VPALVLLCYHFFSPLPTMMVWALIPVAGVAEQALVTIISMTIAVGIAVGSLVSGFSHALFPDAAAGKAARASPPSRETASWIALRGTLVVMPVFVLALTDPSFYLAAIMKAAALGQQAVRPTRVRPGANWWDQP